MVSGADTRPQHRHTFVRWHNSVMVISLKIRLANFDVLLGMDMLRGCHLTIHNDLFILGV